QARPNPDEDARKRANGDAGHTPRLPERRTWMRTPRTPRMTKERNHSSEGKQQGKRIEGVNARDIPPPDKHNRRQHHSYFQNGNEPTTEGRFIQPEYPPDVEKRQQHRDGENEKKQQIHG